MQERGRLDILVNNAAYQMSHQSISEITTEEFDRVFKTNVYAMFWITKAALPHMQPGSAIINTSSVQAYQPSPNLLHYAMTKAAIVNFTKALAEEAIKQGVRVNAVAPGPVWTPLIPMSFEPQKVAEFGQNSLVGRPAQPAELAPLYVFLASPDSAYITGEVVGITGGKPIS
jgi:NAD(P)-dependent dehydrogenase (short-subunit alcohol dehydrogenase family)